MSKVAVVKGDGIGPEVVDQALAVLSVLDLDLDITEYELGGSRYLNDGFILSDEVLAEWKSFDAILLGAVGHPEVEPGLIERELLLKMRFDLDLYVNQRPFVSTEGKGHDFVVVRENTEGAYVGEGGVLRKGTPKEVATQGSVNTRFGVERCIRYAFGLAAQRSNKLHLVHKTNVLNYSGDLWNRTFEEVSKEFPGVETNYHHVDAACIHMVENPGTYDVIVTDNLFGDIITDLAGAVSGGIGSAASANLNPDRTGPSMFEPVHGSAPDIAGQNKANPVAAIRSLALMLEFLGFAGQAERVDKACHQASGDMTTEIGQSVVGALS